MLDAAEGISKCADKVKETVTAILGNQMQTSIKNATDAKKAANKLFTAITPKLDSTRQRVEAAIEQLELVTQLPKPKDATEAVYASEVRAALLRMTQAERSKAVAQAIDEGDDAFVSAAVTGNVVLSGLGKAEAVALTDAWRRKRHGDTVERIDRLRAGLAEFNRVSSLLGGWSLGLLAEQNAAIAIAERSAELAKAAMAEVA